MSKKIYLFCSIYIYLLLYANIVIIFDFKGKI